MPLKFPILAIMSNYKTTIFSDEIIRLMNYLIKEQIKYSNYLEPKFKDEEEAKKNNLTRSQNFS
jgi:hypothetical protein